MDAPQQRRTSNSDAKPHVPVVPYPAQGHMLALLDLAALLARRGLTITAVVTAGNVALLHPLLAACPSVGVATLPFPSSPLFPEGCSENTRDIPMKLFLRFMPHFAALRVPLLTWCQAQRHSLTAIVSDLFTGWTRSVAAALGARHVMFSPCTAFYLAVAHSLWRDMPQRCVHDDDRDGVDGAKFSALPGSPSFPWRHLSTIYREYAGGGEVADRVRQIFIWSLESECVVANTFADLEASYVEHKLPGLEQRRLLAVGPLSEAVGVGHTRDRGGKPAVAAAEVAAWLDAFEDSSVVYVNFGTQFALSPAQAASMAEALARSQAAFMWAAGSTTVVPEGFEAATAARGRGVVIRGWAPQVEILRHRAVGWILMHCGTNAMLEAIAAGVAVLAWPMGADHFTNAALLAEAGFAEGADAVPDAGQMAKAIAAAVGPEGRLVRERAAELRRKAAAAVAEGGSSHRDLEELVQTLTSA
ncbi:hypothetical protein ACP4OV_028519 [Aristida adscensionis]